MILTQHLKTLKFFTSIEGLIILGSLVGILFPSLAKLSYPMLFYSLAIMFYMSIISIKTSKNKKLYRRDSLIKFFFMSVVKLFVIPLFLFHTLAYGLSILKIKNFALTFGVVLRFFAAPSFGTPSYVKIYKGNHNRSFILTIFSNLISILSIPVLICILSEEKMNFQYFFLIMKDVITITIPPFLLGLYSKRKHPYIVQKIIKNESWIIKILIFIVCMGSVIGVREKIINNPNYVLIVSIVAIMIYFLLSFIGWTMEKGQREDKICSSIFYSVNASSTIIYAHLFFKNDSTVYTAVAIVSLFQFIPYLMVSHIYNKKSWSSD